MIYEGKQKIWSDYQKDIPDDHYFTSAVASDRVFSRLPRRPS